MSQWIKLDCAAFLEGVDHLTMGERGAYATLLFKQETNPFKTNLGHMSEGMIANFLRDEYEEYWPRILHKFEKDDQGLWYNKRMERVILERMGRSLAGQAGASSRHGSVTTPVGAVIEYDGCSYDIYTFTQFVVDHHPKRYGTDAAKRKLREDLLAAGPKLQDTAMAMMRGLMNYRASKEVKDRMVMKVSRWADEWRDWAKDGDGDDDGLEREQEEKKAAEIREELKRKGLIK